MDPEIIVSAIGEHLGALEKYVNALILISAAVAWAAIRRAPEIELLGAKFNRRHAFFAAASLYLVANVTILILFLRLGDLFSLLPDEQVIRGFTTLTSNAWVMNPFSYFGTSFTARMHSGEGLGLLVVTWWLCNTALFLLLDQTRERVRYILLCLFCLIGLGAMYAVHRTNIIVLSRLQGEAPELHAAFLSSFVERAVGTLLGIVVGALLFRGAERLRGIGIGAPAARGGVASANPGA
jgi:hypothetical protein